MRIALEQGYDVQCESCDELRQLPIDINTKSMPIGDAGAHGGAPRTPQPRWKLGESYPGTNSLLYVALDAVNSAETQFCVVGGGVDGSERQEWVRVNVAHSSDEEEQLPADLHAQWMKMSGPGGATQSLPGMGWKTTGYTPGSCRSVLNTVVSVHHMHHDRMRLTTSRWNTLKDGVVGVPPGRGTFCMLCIPTNY